MTACFDRIPDELLALILANLDAASLNRAGCVNQRWRRVVQDDGSWRRALAKEFGRLPMERLEESWRQELSRRLRLRRYWRSSRSQRRVEFRALVGLVDHLVAVNGGKAWAVSVAGASATHVDIQAPRVIGDAIRVAPGRCGSSVATRTDAIIWGLDDGGSAIAHLAVNGRLRNIVNMADGGGGGGRAPVLAVAGSMDALAQQARIFNWRAAHGLAGSGPGLVASADAAGCVRVWDDGSGKILHILDTESNERLTQVAWADGGGLVAAASRKHVFIWDLRTASKCQCTVDLPRGCGGVVALAGDLYAPAFFIATARAGVWLMDAQGEVIRRYVAAGGCQVTAFALNAADPTRRLPGLANGSCSPAPAAPAASTSTACKKAVPKPSSSPRVLRITSSSSPTITAQRQPLKRTLLIGDASGSLTMFDADARAVSDSVTNLVQPIHTWTALHRMAVAAISVNAAIIASAGRNGQIHVTDPLSGAVLTTMRCTGGGRQAGRTTWHHQLHPALTGAQIHPSVRLAQLLGMRSRDQWAAQISTVGGGANARSLDRLDHDNVRTDDMDDDEDEPAWTPDRDEFDPVAMQMQFEGPVAAGETDRISGFFAWTLADAVAQRHRFPTLVAHLAIGPDWLLATSAGFLYASIPVQSGLENKNSKKKKKSQAANEFKGRKALRELSDEVAKLQLETESERLARIGRAEKQMRIMREFGDPEAMLGLDAEEQLEYALWLSSNQAQSGYGIAGGAGGSSNGGSSRATEHRSYDLADALEGMTEEEQIQYAIMLSSSQHSNGHHY
ncbi:hypothetical protein GGI07_002548 [Coemansia sp. Benny D115]|nr:hypothetical protein GGI07_002548 [Coemansia sp. Benny D115]